MLWPHTPSKQSAGSSSVTDSALTFFFSGASCWCRANPAFNPEQFLHVMTDLVSDHIALGEIADGA